MSTATSLPGRDERDDLAASEGEIVDLNASRESPNAILIRRLENMSVSTRGRLAQLLSFGRYDPKHASLEAAVAERAVAFRQGRTNAAIAEPLKPLVGKADRKLEALRDKDQGYQHVVDYYQAKIRKEQPETKNVFTRLWRRVRGDNSVVRDAKRKIAMVTEARAETSAALEADPREQLRREIAGADRDVRMRLVKLAPSIAPRLNALLQVLASGDDAPLKNALKAASVPTDDIDDLIAAAKPLKGEYANLGWRALGALGTAVTFGLNKKFRGLAAGAKNQRGIELASYYGRQADERAVYEQLSVAGQVRALPSLPIGSVILVDGRQMVYERLQEKKGRRIARLVQVDDAKQVFLLDITDPDAPVFKRAIGGGQEVAYRAYRDSGSRLPAFGPRESRAAPDRREPLYAAVLSAIAADDEVMAQAKLNELGRLITASAVSTNGAVLQDARSDAVAELNRRLIASGSAARVRLAGDRLFPELPSLNTSAQPSTTTDAAPAVNRDAALVNAANPLVAALGTDIATRKDAAESALAFLAPLVAAAPDDATAAAIVARVNEMIATAHGSPVPAEVTLNGRDLGLIFTAMPVTNPTPAIDAATNPRETMAEALDRQLDALRTLSAEHRRAENRSSSQWWNANRGRYVAFRTHALPLRSDGRARSDDAFSPVFQLLTQRIESTIEPAGDFPGGHDAIDSLISDIADVTHGIRPAAAVS